MKKAEGHIFCLGLYEILRQPSNILAKPCQFKMLQRTNTGPKNSNFPRLGASRLNRRTYLAHLLATSDITA
jgi:hypothetical protein